MIGALDALRLDTGPFGDTHLTVVVVPIFAATGLVVGAVVAGVERLVAGRPTGVIALGLAAPSLIVTIPVASSLVQGAYAQTLPLAAAMPVIVPVALWLALAGVIALGRRVLRKVDLTTRGLVILGCAGAIGGVVWMERHPLASGYPTAHLGATFALIVIAGCAVRAARSTTVPRYLTAVIAAITLGAAGASALDGLDSPNERRVLATFGDQGRDLVQLWRQVFDRDRDGSSALLGGGDCDDGDPARHPGAADLPGDGIDQDCDGRDSELAPSPARAPRPVAVAAWRDSPPVRAVLERTKDMNVLLITIDALRFDMLAPAAADRADFPRLTRLLDDSVLFTRAVAPASGTDASLSTLVTGRLDPFQRVATTLPEAMRAIGLRTYSAIPVEVTRYVGDVLLARGIDRARPVFSGWTHDDVGDHVSAPATTLEGIRALDDAGARRSFVWLHYFDVHEHHQIQIANAMWANVHPGTTPTMTKYRVLLREIDKEVGHMLDELAARHLDARTLIVLASDHGESLGEDPRLLETHGRVTYAPLVRIPIAFHVPGVAGGVRTDAVSLVDLAPTLLALLGAPTAIAPLDGVDLVPALLDAPPALRAGTRALVVHEELQWSVIEWPHQLIVRPAEDLVELYDLEADPIERDDLAARMPALVSHLRARFAAAPLVRIDRTLAGRTWREQQAQPVPRSAP